MGILGKDLAVRNANLDAEDKDGRTPMALGGCKRLGCYPKRLSRFVLTPRSYFDMQHGVNLDSIRTQDMSIYSWDEALHT